jgi:hypothetical protein
VSTTRDLLAAGRTNEAIAHRATQPPPKRRFRMPGDEGPVMDLLNGLYPHELEGRIIALRHVTVVPIKMTSAYAYDCIVVASDHDAYPVGGYLLSIPVAELGSGTLHDGPRPTGDPASDETGDEDGDGPVSDEDFAAFAEGAGFDPQLPEPTDDELVALHGPSTETLEDHLDRWEADSGGLTRHLAEVHGIDSPYDRPPVDAGGWEVLDSLHRHAHAGDADA